MDFIAPLPLPLQKVFVEPRHGLQEGLLLGKPLGLDGGVAADGKAVLDLRVEVDLVGLADLLEDLLGAVALLGGEDGVGLGGRDGQWARDGLELVLVDERGVGDVADVDAVLVVADDVLRVDDVLVRGLQRGLPLCVYLLPPRTLAPKQ